MFFAANNLLISYFLKKSASMNSMKMEAHRGASLEAATRSVL